MSFTGPTFQFVLMVFRFGAGIVSLLAFRSGITLWSTLSCESLLYLICSESIFLLCQDVELVLDCKVGLGIDNCSGGGILIWESGKELFEEHLFCKCMSKAFICCYDPHSCRLERYPCIFDFSVLWKLECRDLCNVLLVCLRLDLTIFRK